MDRQLQRSDGRRAKPDIPSAPGLYRANPQPLHPNQRTQVNVHEFQAKQLLAQFGVPIPPGEVCATGEAARSAAHKLISEGATLIAVKSQIHSGGRGKGTFKSGFKGGVKLCKTAEEVYNN